MSTYSVLPMKEFSGRSLTMGDLSAKVSCVFLMFSFQENLAAQYLAKVRKLQKDLEDAEDRAETAESALSKARSRARAGGGTAIGRQTSREVSRPLSSSSHLIYRSYPSSLYLLSSPSSNRLNRLTDKYSSFY